MELLAAEHDSEEHDDGALNRSGDDYGAYSMVALILVHNLRF
jgi:hypothetical protein